MRISRATRYIALLSLLTLGAFSLQAQNVDKNELQSVKDKKIEFINFEGSHATTDSEEQISGLGDSLGSAIAKGAKSSGDRARYFVIHAVDPTQKTGLDADILYLGPQAQVDHIRNLRLIIAGYIGKAYGYSRADALILAEYATIYNAVYRQDLAFFQSRYKEVVTKNLDKSNAGLALRYDEWPGKSRIVIPLVTVTVPAANGKGTESKATVSSSGLTDSKVTNELRKQEDKGIDTRKGMIDLKEREIQQTEAQNQKKADEVKKDEQTLQKEKDKLAQEQAKLDTLKQADKGQAGDKGEGQSSSLTKKGEDNAKTEQNKAVQEQQKKVDEQQKKVDEQQKAVEQKKDELAQSKATNEQKKDEVTQERQGVAQDQRETIRTETGGTAKEEKPTKSLTLLEALSLTSPYSRLLTIDLDSGKTLQAGDLSTINSRTLIENGSSYFCVAESQSKPGTYVLTQIDKASLKVSAQGTDALFPDTSLTLRDGNYWAILAKGGRYYVAQLGQDLKLVMASDLAVHPYTALMPQADGLVAQLAEGGFVLLGSKDLKLIKTLK
jgi:hypothetical protein